MPTSRVLQFQLEAAQEAEMLAAEVAKKASSDVEMCGESGSKHTYSSLSEMLQLASLDKVCVEGDGNCGFYALHLASGGSLDHCSVERAASTPTADDYVAQQALRAKCHSWLIDQGEAVVASQLQADLEQSLTPSRWQSDQIKKILEGKQRRGARMGEYCADPSLRAMAAVLNVHLVVVDSKCGPGVPTDQRGKPPDRVAVYLPGSDPRRVKRARSWANDVAPVLARKQAQGSLATDPEYRVIIHNGEPPGSRSGHFDGTCVTIA